MDSQTTGDRSQLVVLYDVSKPIRVGLKRRKRWNGILLHRLAPGNRINSSRAEITQLAPSLSELADDVLVTRVLLKGFCAG